MANKALSSLGAVATATETTGGGSQDNPTFAIDNNGSTYCLVVHGGAPGTTWLKVDLQTAQLIQSFRLTFVNSTWTPGQYRIESSNDNVVWASRYYHTNTASTGTDTGKINLFTPVTARYWRVRQVSIPATTTGMGPVAFELHDDADGADPGTDPESGEAVGGWTLGSTNFALLSLGASATSNRSNHQGTTPGQAIDNNAGTYYLCQKGGDPSWIRVDLGQERSIAGWSVQWINSSWYASAYTIEASVDDSTWDVIHTASGQTDAGVASATAFANANGATARYWRIRSSSMPGEGMGPTTFALYEGTPPVSAPAPPPKWINTVGWLYGFTSESATVTLPAEVQHNDLLVFAVALQPSRASYSGSPYVPSGWAKLTANGERAVHVFYKVWQTGDLTNAEFGFFGGNLAGHGTLSIFRRFNVGTPTAGSTLNEYTSSATPSTTAFDPDDWSGDSNALLACIWSTAGTRPRTMTAPPADSTLYGGFGNSTDGVTQVTTKPHSSKSSAPAQTATFNTAQEGHAFALMIRPEATGGDTHEGAASVSAGATQSAALVQGTIGTASVSAVVTVAADGVKEKPGEAEGGAVVTVAADGVLMLGGHADIEAVIEEPDANGVVGIGGKANVDALVVVQMNGGYELWAEASIAATAEGAGDLLQALAGEADLFVTATLDPATGYTVVAGIGDRNALAIMVGRASLLMFGESAVDATASLEPTPDGSVTKPGAASRYAVASAYAFGGKLLPGVKTIVGRASVDVAGFTGPGGTGTVVASATLGLAEGVLAEVGATDPIDVPTARATVTPATPDLTLGAEGLLEATALFYPEPPGTIIFSGNSARFAVVSADAFGGYLLEGTVSVSVSVTTNQPDLLIATPGTAAVAVSATVSQPEGILEKWGIAVLLASATTAFLQGDVIYGAATDLTASAVIEETLGGLVVKGHISALAQVFRSARGGYQLDGVGAISATAQATSSGLGMVAGNAHAVVEAHVTGNGSPLSGGIAFITARATVLAGGGVQTRAAASVSAVAGYVAAGKRLAGGQANVLAIATISDFSGSILLAEGDLVALATVEAIPQRIRSGQASRIARATTTAAAAVARLAAADLAVSAVLVGQGIPGSNAESAPGVTVGLLGGIWHQGWCLPMAVSTAVLADTTVIRTNGGEANVRATFTAGAVAWPRSGFAVADSTASLTGRLRRLAAASLAVSAQLAGSGLRQVRGHAQIAVSAGATATGRPERNASAEVAVRATFWGFGGVQGRADLVVAATASGAALTSRDVVAGTAQTVFALATTSLHAGLWHQGLCRPMAVSSVSSAGVWMIWGGSAVVTASAGGAAALARMPLGAADALVQSQARSGSRVARTNGGEASAAVITAVNGAGLVEVRAAVAAVARQQAVALRERRATGGGTVRATVMLRGGLVPEADGNLLPQASITRSGAVLRRIGAASAAAAITATAEAVLRPIGAARLSARVTVFAPGGRVLAGAAAALARVNTAAAPLRVKPGEAMLTAVLTVTADLAQAQIGGSASTAEPLADAFGGLVRQGRATPRATAISAATAVRERFVTSAVTARTTLTGWSFRTRTAEAAVQATVTASALLAEGLAGAAPAHATTSGGIGRLLAARGQVVGRAAGLAFEVYEGETAIVLTTSTSATAARAQMAEGQATITAAAELDGAGLRHDAVGDLGAEIGLSQPEVVNSRLGAAAALLRATVRGFGGRYQVRAGSGTARVTVAGLIARTRIAEGATGGSAQVAGEIGRLIENEAAALLTATAGGSEGRELTAEGHMPVFAGAAGTVGRVVAGAGSRQARASVTAVGRKDREGQASLGAAAEAVARGGLRLDAAGEAAATGELAGSLLPTVSGFCGGSVSGEASASGGLVQRGQAAVIGRASRSAGLARVLAASASVTGRSQAQAGGGHEVAAAGSVGGEAAAAGGLGMLHFGETAVSGEIAARALAGSILQAAASTTQTVGMVAYEAGTLKSAAGVLLAQAVGLAIVAGQVPGLGQVLATAIVAATASSGLPWWGTTPVGAPPRSASEVSASPAGGGTVTPSSPFG